MSRLCAPRVRRFLKRGQPQSDAQAAELERVNDHTVRLDQAGLDAARADG